MENENEKLIASILGIDLVQLAIPQLPQIEKLILPNDLTSRLQFMSKKLSDALVRHQKIMEVNATNLADIAKKIEQQYQPQIAAFQAMAEKLQPIISYQSKLSVDLANISKQVSQNPSLEAIKTMSSFNAFQVYQETVEEFGEAISIENITTEEIEKTFEENKELIEEVNEVVLQGELDGVTPGDTPALIYAFLIKKVPQLNKRTYGIIVLIFTTAVLFYGLYSNYSTNVALDEIVVPTLKQHSKTNEEHTKDLGDIKEDVSDNSVVVKDISAKVDSTHETINNLQNDFEEYKESTNDKLDLIIKEMRKQVNRTKE